MGKECGFTLDPGTGTSNCNNNNNNKNNNWLIVDYLERKQHPRGFKNSFWLLLPTAEIQCQLKLLPD